MGKRPTRSVAEQLSAERAITQDFRYWRTWLEGYEKADTIWMLSFPALFSVY